MSAYERERERATYGAFFIGVGGYAWLTPGLHLPPSWKLGVAALIAFGALLLVVGLRETRGHPRHAMGIFWNLVVLIGGKWVVTHGLPELWADAYGRGFCIGVICSSATRLYIALRGVPALPFPDPGMVYGRAGFTNPNDPGFKL